TSAARHSPPARPSGPATPRLHQSVDGGTDDRNPSVQPRSESQHHAPQASSTGTEGTDPAMSRLNRPDTGAPNTLWSMRSTASVVNQSADVNSSRSFGSRRSRSTSK